MLGKHHSVCAAATFLGAEAASRSHLSHHPAELIVGTVVSAGAGMWPDLDCPQATISRSLGPLTEGISHVVNRVSGGHREGTHGFLALALCTFGVVVALRGHDSALVQLGITVFCAALALHAVFHHSGWRCLLEGCAIAFGCMVLGGLHATVIEVAVGIGYASHLLCDWVTTEGIPPLYPLDRNRHSLPIVGNTGDGRESVVSFLAGVCAVVILFSLVVSPAFRNVMRPNVLPRTAAVTGVR